MLQSVIPRTVYVLFIFELSHRVPGSTGSRNGDEERGTSIFNTVRNDEYTASARSKLT